MHMVKRIARFLMSWRPKTRVGRFVRWLLFGGEDWQQQARRYAAICPHLAMLPPRRRYSCVEKIQQKLWGDPVVFFGFVAIFFASEPVWHLLPAPWDVCGYLIVIWFGVPLLARWILPRMMPNRLRRLVRECVNAYSDLQVCVDCGYDLRGQTVPRCPECGRFVVTTRRSSRRPRE